ncbi:LysE family translocator [Aliiglaciecola sp. 3_MG-2023]|uniref:LysE family translocator n=1 Tax=Aliiglaciecola sp. 3_MG-2023 TaxID=3062644 RepID=UPI0026E13749|nr:LysE family translocator [Aliiglaciecola sp. 3_MG-2023]MDO6694897.1 LysE family translocator [Aliiglaciecola sp. 3_MG-2023]
MPTIDTFLAFSVASIIMSVSPGPSNLYILARTMADGHKSGIAAASGMAIGSMTYVLLTALGLATVFRYSPTAYTMLKLCGAAYLIFLGIQAFKGAGSEHAEKPKVRLISIPKVFRQGILVELTNPKTALFFLAFLPQFVDPEIGQVALQIGLLGAVYTLIAYCSDLMVVQLSKKLGKWLSSHPLFVAWQDRLAGSILFGLGAYIGWQEITN